MFVLQTPYIRKLILPVLLILLMSVNSVETQPHDIQLTVALPNHIRASLSPDFFDQFEFEHPNIRVDFTDHRADNFYGQPISGIETYFERVQAYVSSADVVYVSDDNLSIEATRAGLFLDISPLISVDPTFHDGLYPSIRDVFMWDQGVWGLPSTVQIEALIYNQGLFDDANLPYPTANWSSHDYVTNLTEMYQFLLNSGHENPLSMYMSDPYAFISSFLSINLSPDDLMSSPSFTHPDMLEIIETWQRLFNQNIVSSTVSHLNFATLPMISGNLSSFFAMNNRENSLSLTLLSNSSARLHTHGFALSGGTNYADEAYLLAKYIAEHEQIIRFLPGDMPAKMSETDNYVSQRNYSTDIVDFALNALTNGYGLSSLHFGYYINDFFLRASVSTEPLDVLQTLQDYEAIAQSHLAITDGFRTENIIQVNPPIAVPAVSQDEVILRFGMYESYREINPNGWESFINSFVANDPQVGAIQFLEFQQAPGSTTTYEDFLQSVDCSFASGMSDPINFLDIYPLLRSDINYDDNDFVTGVFQQLQIDNAIYGYPIEINPEVLVYDPDLFNTTGTQPPPLGNWSMPSFLDTLQQLHSTLPAEVAPLSPYGLQIARPSYLQMLIITAGGAPFDYRTHPPAINFSDEATISAIEQVLNLAIDGIIDYRQIIHNRTVSMPDFSFNRAAIYTTVLGPGQFISRIGSVSPLETTLFPTGEMQLPVQYQIRAAYISRNTLIPEACYRWIDALSRQPDLIVGMPARQSLFDNAYMPYGDAYQAFNERLQNPNAVVIRTPSYGNVGGLAYEEIWLYRAFDRYVLLGADLATELAIAEAYAIEYRICISDIEPYNPASFDPRQALSDYNRQYQDCAVNVDVTLQEELGL